ncbi:MAG: hypothetical protein ACRDAM_07095 [Casimicrobium sp.]
MKSLHYPPLLAVVASIALASCGREESKSTSATSTKTAVAQSTNQAPKGMIDVCSKITEEEASKVLMQKAIFNPESKGGNARMIFCSFGPAAGGSPSTLAINVTQYESASIAESALSTADKMMESMTADAKKAGGKGTDITIESIEGLGNQALLKRGGLHGAANLVVLRGSIAYSFNVQRLDWSKVDTKELITVVKRVLN